MHHIFFNHSFVSGHLGCVYVLAIVSGAAVNVGAQVTFPSMVFFRYVLRSGIGGPYGSSIFSFLRNLHTVLPVATLNSHQQDRKFPFYPQPI